MMISIFALKEQPGAAAGSRAAAGLQRLSNNQQVHQQVCSAGVQHQLFQPAAAASRSRCSSTFLSAGQAPTPPINHYHHQH